MKKIELLKAAVAELADARNEGLAAAMAKVETAGAAAGPGREAAGLIELAAEYVEHREHPLPEEHLHSEYVEREEVALAVACAYGPAVPIEYREKHW